MVGFGMSNKPDARVKVPASAHEGSHRSNLVHLNPLSARPGA
jgi:hypothetical protein